MCTAGEGQPVSCRARLEYAALVRRPGTMTLGVVQGPAACLAVFVAAAIEGEVVFVAASVLAGTGHLRPLIVLACGALGGSAGDQFFYYACRGRLARWLERLPALARRRHAIAQRVVRRAPLLILACRFLPGLRIAIPAACAYAGVSPWLFSTLSLVGGFAWATAILTIVAWGGPDWLARVGLRGPWAAAVIVFFRWLARVEDLDL